MTVYCDLEIESETALELLRFLQLHRASSPSLAPLFDEIERLINDSLDYESQYISGSLRKSERH